MTFELSVLGLHLLSVTVGLPGEDAQTGVFLDVLPTHRDVEDFDDEDGDGDGDGDEGKSLPFGFALPSE